MQSYCACHSCRFFLYVIPHAAAGSAIPEGTAIRQARRGTGITVILQANDRPGVKDRIHSGMAVHVTTDRRILRRHIRGHAFARFCRAEGSSGLGDRTG